MYDEAIYQWVDKNTYAWTESDPVSSKLGNGWRMSTKADWDELMENCDISFSWRNYDGMIVVTSKINGNKIYLAPNIPGDMDYFGSGYYWVQMSPGDNYYFHFYSVFDDDTSHWEDYQKIEFSALNNGSRLIRPVREK